MNICQHHGACATNSPSFILCDCFILLNKDDDETRRRRDNDNVDDGQRRQHDELIPYRSQRRGLLVPT
jgi:hypothetical protein